MEPFAFDIVDTARVMRRDFDRRAAVLGVTRAQWRVLVVLRRRDGSRQVDLAEALDVEPITLCRMIDRLEEAQLVERRPDPTDRRARLIYLTERAQPIIEELQAIGTSLHADALAGITEDELETARDVLARVRLNLTKGGEQAAKKAS